MAKNKDTEKKEGTSKIASVLIIVLLITTWLSTMLLLIKCDVGGFGSDVLRPVFKDVPVIKEFLPPPSDEEVAKESDYPYDTLEKALARITEQDAAISQKDAEILALSEQIQEMSDENARLKTFETDYNAFVEEKNKFYEEIVYGETAPDTDTYIEWYNQLDAESAARIYKEIMEAKEADDEIKDLAKAYESMDAANAAKVFEEMKYDLDTVALIMNNMSTEARGKILNEMDPEFAALVTKKLLP